MSGAGDILLAGSLVVIEGIEGSGKSTLLLGLAERLRSQGHNVLVTREPGGTAVGEAIREIFLNQSIAIGPLTESLLVNAARAQHVADVIGPALASGRMVLGDRFTDSTLAYQGYGRGVDLEVLRMLCATATGGIEPDLVLVLDVPLSVARARLHGRSEGMDRIETEHQDFHERVRQGFLALARGSKRHIVLNAARPAGDLADQALSALQARLKLSVP